MVIRMTALHRTPPFAVIHRARLGISLLFLKLNRDPDGHQEDGVTSHTALCRHTGLAPVSRSCF